MTYREKLELYSQGKLDEQQTKEIERELEKQEALADYLFEHQAPPGMDDLFDGTSPFGIDKEQEASEVNEETEDESAAIAKQINSSIRRAFIKTGVIATIIAVILTLFIVFALPHIVSAFYYNPSQSIGTDSNGVKVEQFERDMSVYSEMFMPELGPQISVGTENYGYGNYSYYLDARFEVGSDNEYEVVKHVYTGNIKRNSVVCYNYEELESFNKQESYITGDANSVSRELDRMNETDLYYAYVTLDRDVPYEEFYADYVGNDVYGTNGSWVWCGVRVSDDEKINGYYNEGFFATACQNRSSCEYDVTKYPNLIWQEGSEDIDTEQKAITHFKSMIRYLTDNEKFASLDNHLNIMHDLWSIDETEKYISNNGINVYGFIYVSNKKHIVNVSKDNNIIQVAVKNAF
ncbi:MAG: anti sigma factor C-terminal domain-containing protein [Firmicutes bacterium]|nr:anti sigma factor C-terminal domain-containing protein [Bacillota bacterium]